MVTKVLRCSADPFAVFQKFYGRRGLFFLDSGLHKAQGRFSYIGFDPFKIVSGNDLAALEKAWRPYRTQHSGPYFCGGAVGYLAYEGPYHFGLYDQVLVFDHGRRALIARASNPRQLTDIIHQIQNGIPHVPVLRPGKLQRAKSNFSRAAYIAAVRNALDRIRRGDIYQINLSRIVETLSRQRIDPLLLYGILRRRSPSDFSSYFDDGRQLVLSSSPECFVRLSNGLAQVRPMKGTRPRGGTAMQDARLKAQLKSSAKEIAELLMVTDLERNDLGQVCAYGSVKVKAMRTIEAYRTVFQATSTIEGRLAAGRSGFDLLKAAFPSGSVTGCPKHAAMAIIKQLEKAPRRLYTGALGYIDFNGNMEFSVLIRTLFMQGKKIRFHVGGGIVADSDPAAEYEETCVKARAMQEALEESVCA